MAFIDVLAGNQSYPGWIQAQDTARHIGREVAEAHAPTEKAVAHLARVAEVGLGAIEEIGLNLHETLSQVGFEIGGVAGGIAALNADLNLRLAEIIWQAQQQNEKLDRLIYASEHPETIRAREKRDRGRFAHCSGLWDDAKRNYEESLRLNEFDFSVHRSLGDLHLLHFSDPRTAFSCYSAAARYARAYGNVHAAENLYMAGISAAILQKREAALRLFEEAFGLLPYFGDAAYNAAAMASLLNRPDKLVGYLERAITIDGRYLARARESKLFAAASALLEPRLCAIEVHERELTHACCTRLLHEAERVADLPVDVSASPAGEWARDALATIPSDSVPKLRQTRGEAANRIQGLFAAVAEAASRQRARHAKEMDLLAKWKEGDSGKAKVPLHQAQNELSAFVNRDKSLDFAGFGCVGLIVLWATFVLMMESYHEVLPRALSAMSRIFVVGATAVSASLLTVVGLRQWKRLRLRTREARLTNNLEEAQRLCENASAAVAQSYSERSQPHENTIREMETILEQYRTLMSSPVDEGAVAR
jgi:tetratricopeptide (TPR) repeat protein